MAAETRDPVIRYLHTLLGLDGVGPKDAELLARFVGGRDDWGPFAISPDGKLAIARIPAAPKKMDLHFVRASGDVLSRITPTQNSFYSGTYFTSDSKKLILSSLGERRIEVFECPSGRLLHTFSDDGDEPKADKMRRGLRVEEHEQQFVFRNLIVSPDGTLLANCADAQTITIWDLTTGRRRGSLTQLGQPSDQKGKKGLGTRPFQSGAFSVDGRCLALDSPDGCVIVYELATAQQRFEYGGKQFDGKKRLYFDGGLSLIATEPKGSPRLAFSPNSRTFVHAGPDQIVRLWNTSTGQELAAFRGHTGPLTAVAFAPDGRSVASAGWDTTALIWDVSQWLSPTVVQKKLEHNELTACWDLLAANDGTKAFGAIVAMTASPGDVIPFIEQRLKPAAPIEPGRVESYIADLDNSDFKVREKANTELLDIADIAAPTIEKALANNPALETRRRLEALLEKSGTTSMILHGDRLRAYRVVEILERIGTPEARRLLTSYANAAPGALLTTSAEAALKR